MTNDDLKFVFHSFGRVLEAEVISNARGSKGFGFVTFAHELDADRAKSLMHRSVIDGRMIEVNDALPRNKFRIMPSPALMRTDACGVYLQNLSARHTLVPLHSAVMQQAQRQSSLPIPVPDVPEWYKRLNSLLLDRPLTHRQPDQGLSSSADLLTPLSSSSSECNSPDYLSSANEYRLFN